MGIEISTRDDFHDLLAWVKASKRRFGILQSLGDNPKNSTELANQGNVTNEAIHYHLDLLRRGGPNGDYPALVRIITPDRERYRLWGLTHQGQQLVEYLE